MPTYRRVVKAGRLNAKRKERIGSAITYLRSRTRKKTEQEMGPRRRPDFSTGPDSEDVRAGLLVASVPDVTKKGIVSVLVLS